MCWWAVQSLARKRRLQLGSDVHPTSVDVYQPVHKQHNAINQKALWVSSSSSSFLKMFLFPDAHKNGGAAMRF